MGERNSEVRGRPRAVLGSRPTMQGARASEQASKREVYRGRERRERVLFSRNRCSSLLTSVVSILYYDTTWLTDRLIRTNWCRGGSGVVYRLPRGSVLSLLGFFLSTVDVFLPCFRPLSGMRFDELLLSPLHEIWGPSCV